MSSFQEWSADLRHRYMAHQISVHHLRSEIEETSADKFNQFFILLKFMIFTNSLYLSKHLHRCQFQRDACHNPSIVDERPKSIHWTFFFQKLCNRIHRFLIVSKHHNITKPKSRSTDLIRHVELKGYDVRILQSIQVIDSILRVASSKNFAA